jgi:hypothetical protein
MSISRPAFLSEKGTASTRSDLASIILLPPQSPVSLQNELIKLTGDCGGRNILETKSDLILSVPFSDKNAGLDIDIPEDYEQVRKLLGLH